MKVPPKRKGNQAWQKLTAQGVEPSMKVPPKRKGNSVSKVLKVYFFSPQ